MFSCHDFQRFFAAIAIAFGIAVFPGTASGQSADGGREQAILVLDASGSMWGQIDGVSKIEIAREQIASVLDDWDPGLDLGLMTYGHRVKGDCADIELVLPPQPVDPQAFQSAVNAISPKGKTPLSDSVLLAAEELKFTENRATVILLSDGLETCEADPCALAQSLEAQGVDFTAHVIGFDIAETEASQLSCLADNTGGKFFLAGDADQLTQALAETVQTIVVAETVPAPEPEPEPEPAGPQGIRAVAKLCDSCDLLENDVFWYVYEAETNLQGKRKEVSRNGNAQHIFELAAGEYHLLVLHGAAQATADVSVEPGRLSEAVVVMNAGNLRITAEAAPGGTQLDDGLFYYLYEAKQNLEGNRREVTRSGDARPLLRLNAGDYHILAKHGDAEATADVGVEAGSLTDYVLNMDVGYLRITPVPTEGAAPLEDNQFYYVYEAKTDLEGNRREVARSAKAQPLLRLNAGDYQILATHGDAKARFDVSVRADSLTEETFDMNLGYLRVANVMAEGMPPIENGLFYYVYEAETDFEGNRREVARSAYAKPLFRLNAGDYHLVAVNGASRTTADVMVEAGALHELTMVQNSALLRVEATLEEGGAAVGSGVFWYVLEAEQDLDGNRKEAARFGQAKPLMTLKAGNYLLHAQYGNADYFFPVELTPGEVKEMTVLLQK